MQGQSSKIVFIINLFCPPLSRQSWTRIAYLNCYPLRYPPKNISYLSFYSLRCQCRKIAHVVSTAFWRLTLYRYLEAVSWFTRIFTHPTLLPFKFYYHKVVYSGIQNRFTSKYFHKPLFLYSFVRRSSNPQNNNWCNRRPVCGVW